MTRKSYLLSEIPNLQILGRHSQVLTPLTLFWHGSGIEVAVRAKELWASFYTEYDAYEQWISIWVDGALVARQILPQGKSMVPLLLNADPALTHVVRVVKEVQPMTADTVNLFQICALETDGTFEALPPKKCKLEFIGDSLTSGEGTLGAIHEMTWNAMVMGASFAYPLLTADALSADFRLFSQGGWGVYCSFDGDATRNMPDYYEQICSMLEGEKEAKCGAKEENDFAAWQPDAIVVNLGTNDASSGASTKQVQDAVIAFLSLLRRRNPKAYIIWGYGSFDQPLAPFIREAVEQYIDETGDKQVEALKFPLFIDEWKGSREHPGRMWHRQVQALLVETIGGRLESL